VVLVEVVDLVVNENWRIHVVFDVEVDAAGGSVFAPVDTAFAFVVVSLLSLNDGAGLIENDCSDD
jgi:hypothetical protein